MHPVELALLLVEEQVPSIPHRAASIALAAAILKGGTLFDLWIDARRVDVPCGRLALGKRRDHLPDSARGRAIRRARHARWQERSHWPLAILWMRLVVRQPPFGPIARNELGRRVRRHAATADMHRLKRLAPAILRLLLRASGPRAEAQVSAASHRLIDTRAPIPILSAVVEIEMEPRARAILAASQGLEPRLTVAIHAVARE